MTERRVTKMELWVKLLHAAEHRLEDVNNEDGSGLELFWAVYDLRHWNPSTGYVEYGEVIT